MKKPSLKDIENNSLLIGGAIRDNLLGREITDRDFLVIGYDERDLIDLGFLRTGTAVSTYLHPETKEEYNLPRGSDPNSIFEDLKARDFTINSMAQDQKGEIIDPFGGQDDIEESCLRHTSEHFSDDPLRVYRAARFIATLPSFKIHQTTKKLIQDIAKSPEFDHIPGERIYTEMVKVIKNGSLKTFFNTLKELDILQYTFPHFEEQEREGSLTPTLNTIHALQQENCSHDILFSAMICFPESHHGKKDIVLNFIKNKRLPKRVNKLSMLFFNHHKELKQLSKTSPEEIYYFLKEADFKRNPDLLEAFTILHKRRYPSYISDDLLKYAQHLRMINFKEYNPKGLTKRKVDDIYLTALSNFLSYV